MPSKETPSGSCEKTGGGEWTALREAQIKMRDACFRDMLNVIKNCHTDVPEDTSGKTALAVLHESVEQQGVEGFGEALAAAAPAPPATPLSECKNPDCPVGCPDSHTLPFDSDVAPPPQDGQGSELLGPPSSGQLSHLADQLSQVRAALVWLLENQPGTVWCNGPDESNGVNCTACNARTWKEGETLVHMPECQFANALALAGMPTVTRNGAVAGNASAPVGEKRQPSEVQQVPVQPSITQRGKNDGSPVKRDPANGPDSDLAGQPSGVGEPRQALCEALDCIGDNIDIAGTEWADRPMKQWMSDWRAALATPSPTEGASSPADARTELVQKEVGEGLREAPEKLLGRLGFHFLGDCDCVTKAECYERTLQIVNEWAALAAPAPIPTEGLREGDEVLLRAKIYHIRAGTNPRCARGFKLMVKDGDEEHVLFVTAAALTPAPKPAPPDYAPAWEEINKVRYRAEKLLDWKYLGWNWVHALVDKLEKQAEPTAPKPTPPDEREK